MLLPTKALDFNQWVAAVSGPLILVAIEHDRFITICQAHIVSTMSRPCFIIFTFILWPDLSGLKSTVFSRLPLVGATVGGDVWNWLGKLHAE